jgi:hypothetical protein
VPFRKNTTPSLTIVAPRGGYIVPAGYASEIGEKLALHGIAFERVPAAINANVECFRATHTEFSSTPFEGCTRLKAAGEWHGELRVVPAGSLFVPIAQAHARLLMMLLEPQAPDSLAAWGFFNGCFEQKEHLESYVAEMIGHEMLAADPKLAAEFERRLKEDAAFAADPVARREFFHRRHASWDERFNLYPVYRVSAKIA